MSAPRLKAWITSRSGARLIGVATVLALVGMIEIAIRAGLINRFIVPLPSEILLAIPRIITEENVLHRFWQTAQEVLWASLFASALGCSLGACAPGRGHQELVIELPADVSDGLQLSWQRVNGADGYRLLFARMTGAPACTLRVDAAKLPGYLLRRDSLPEPLGHAQELTVEIRAMRHGKLMEVSGMRPLKTP